MKLQENCVQQLLPLLKLPKLRTHRLLSTLQLTRLQIYLLDF